jgi:respiratory nitrite reductase (cytochrome; ammonia-forming) precursor (EC 1.7.2.2)
MVAQDTSVKAHEAIRMASEFTGEKPADYDKLMIEARQTCRKGQFFWDLVSAENSVGFHNPTKALDTLAKSQQYSQKAVDIAIKAAAFTTAEALSQDIKELVPPIMEAQPRTSDGPGTHGEPQVVQVSEGHAQGRADLG